MINICFVSILSKAQIGINSQWTWIKGDSTVYVDGVYGSQGIPAITNKPGAREGSVTWTDSSGGLWLFGGTPNGIDMRDDLWKYDPSANQWTWMKGDNFLNAGGEYGTQGIAATGNKPKSRELSVSWKDNLGNLWLFGGRGFDFVVTYDYYYLNDLWKYDPLADQWTWMNGDSTVNISGVYGSLGIPSAANNPGARQESVSWKDASGNLWLFGGRNYTSFGYLNDLWKYDPLTNQWTWVKGDSTVNTPGVYGSLGIPSAANKPGSRFSGTCWTDVAGNFWLFGGLGYSSLNNVSGLNDLWKYNPSTNQWTWVKGDSTAGGAGVYCSQGVPAVDNTPGERDGSISWKEASGNLWLVGGDGISNVLNDLWEYDISTNQWTWIKGDSVVAVPGVYGTQGIPATTNKPGARFFSGSWTDGPGNLWLFGGSGFAAGSLSHGGYLNDLWKLSNASVVPVTLLNISAQVVQKNVQVNWQTSQEINTSHFIIERSADGTNFSALGSVTAAGNSSSTRNYSFKDNLPLQGISFYRIQMVDEDGRYKYSSVVSITLNAVQKNVTVFPNPVISTAIIKLSNTNNAEIKFRLYDSNGSLVIAKQISLFAGNNSFLLDMSKLSKGVYTAVIDWSNENEMVKISKN